MKFITSALLLLLPFTAIAVPAPDSAESRSVAQSGEEIFDKRAEELCSIINVSNYVNCRSGPGTGYSVVTTFKEGEKWYYSCYEPGTCTEGNWYVIYQSFLTKTIKCINGSGVHDM